MDMRQITPTFFVSPQIDPSDANDIAAAGVTLVIDNRPDAEIPPSHQADAMEQAVRAAGVAFAKLPLTHQTMTAETVGQQFALATHQDGVVLAYCASGTRSTIAWALGQAQQGTFGVDEIISAARAGGYDIENMRNVLTDLVDSRS